MRLDRFITLNIVRPWRRMFSESGSPKHRTTETPSQDWPVPVLMYHNIIDDPEPGISPYYKVNTSPRVFAEHMQFLADHGYKTITISDLVSSLASHRPTVPPYHRATVLGPVASNPKLVAITFDDGFSSVFKEAYPVLKKHGFIATVFLPTAFIGDDRRQFRPRGSALSNLNGSGGSRRPDLSGNPQLSTSAVPNYRTTEPPKHGTTDCLTWSEVREMSEAGIEFGSHTVNHPKLVDLGWTEIETELQNSKTEIERRLCKAVTSFCYPFAFPQTDVTFKQKFQSCLSQAGYDCCITTQLGRVRPGDDVFQLKRLPANSMDDSVLLEAKLHGAYDWLGIPQGFVKALKRHAEPAITMKSASCAPTHAC